jgi:hypothetical protein
MPGVATALEQAEQVQAELFEPAIALAVESVP